MISKEVTVSKEVSAELIPYLVQSACHYESSLYICDGDKKINMKSIMGMTILQLQKGATFILLAEGSDAEKAVEEIAACF